MAFTALGVTLTFGASGSGQDALPWIAAPAAVILSARAIGDGPYFGFTKRVRSSRFARRDDLAFTPTAVLLTFGAVAALLV
ncbi:MAG: hypothetical protein OEM97_10205 [Acidimicrobiia bacterium]|nr:hypothetical protein [Acidimicrobiia bacterium]